MLNAATQTFLGDRSADLVAGYDANLLGTAGSVAFGLSGLDFYKDLSDIAYGLENWENTPGDYLNLGVNLIALIPVIGAFKNLGKPATDAASNVAKQIDDEVANLRAIGANNRSAPDFHNNISQRQPGGNLRAPTSGASSVNAADALRAKLSALQNAQKGAATTRTLPDGRIRYYGPERAATMPGPTRGASFVTEWDPKTGTVRQWMESYDHAGNVVRVHPKMLNGQELIGPHFPPTGKDLGQ